MARAMQSRCCWPPDRRSADESQPVLHFVPEEGGAEAALDDVGQLLPAMVPLQARAIGDVVEDCAGQGNGRSEYQPDPAAQHVDVPGSNLPTVYQDFADPPEVPLAVGEPVQRAGA